MNPGGKIDGPHRRRTRTRFPSFYALEQEYYRLRGELATLKRELIGEQRVAAAYKELVHRLMLPAGNTEDVEGQLALFEGLIVACADISKEEWMDWLAAKEITGDRGEAVLHA